MWACSGEQPSEGAATAFRREQRRPVGLLVIHRLGEHPVPVGQMRIFLPLRDTQRVGFRWFQDEHRNCRFSTKVTAFSQIVKFIAKVNIRSLQTGLRPQTPVAPMNGSVLHRNVAGIEN